MNQLDVQNIKIPLANIRDNNYALDKPAFAKHIKEQVKNIISNKLIAKKTELANKEKIEKTNENSLINTLKAGVDLNKFSLITDGTKLDKNLIQNDTISVKPKVYYEGAFNKYLGNNKISLADASISQKGDTLTYTNPLTNKEETIKLNIISDSNHKFDEQKFITRYTRVIQEFLDNKVSDAIKQESEEALKRAYARI